MQCITVYTYSQNKKIKINTEKGKFNNENIIHILKMNFIMFDLIARATK